MSLFFAMVASGIKGGFLLDTGDDAFQARDTSGSNLSGSLTVAADGEISFTGDTQGNNESGHTWWSPIGTVSGSWHVKLAFVSGQNDYSSGDTTGAWHALSSDRTWNFAKTGVSGPDASVGTWTISFSDDGGSTTHDSVNVTIDMFNQSP